MFVRTLLLLITSFMILSPAHGGEAVIYQHEDTTLEGYLAYPDPEEFQNKRPAVLIAHQWKGLGGYEKRRADMLADLGYIAFALDVYGQGIRPATTKAASAESSKYKDNPDLARERMMAALDHVRGINNVDVEDIAVIGYCFGGTMALELARAGADIDAAVSFHGGLATQEEAEEGKVKAAIQIHHGADDPYVEEDEVEDFREEMNEAQADWHIISYADTVHSFTEKEAGNNPKSGVAYNAKADQRSWAYTLEFLEQVF